MNCRCFYVVNSTRLGLKVCQSGLLKDGLMVVVTEDLVQVHAVLGSGLAALGKVIAKQLHVNVSVHHETDVHQANLKFILKKCTIN